MKSLKILFSALLMAFLAFTSCQKEESETFEFKITQTDGSAVSGVQTLHFDGELKLSITAKGVASTEAAAPNGWTATVSISDRALTIKAPAATDTSAEENGSVKVTAISPSGKKITEEIRVKVEDGAVSLTVSDVSEGLSFVYGETKELSVVTENVAQIDFQGPGGWSAKTNLAQKKVLLTAPMRDVAGAELEGTVTLTPSSARGNAGTPVTFPVSITVTAPTIVFSPTSLSHVDFGSQSVVTATHVENVAGLSLASSPKGWSFIPDLGNMQVKVIAPSESATSYDGEGTFVVIATSPTGETREYSVPVSVKGINNKEEFLSLANGYNNLAEGADPTALVADYIWKGEVVLNTDLDLADTGTANFITREFPFTFNGKGHTINLDYSGDAGEIGLFHTVTAPGKVCNLNFSGAITSTKYGVKLAVVTCISKGGTFENIKSTVNINQTGTDAASDAAAKGFLGVIASDEQGSGTYKKCQNSGPISFCNVKYMGGIIGDIWDETSGTVYECVNSGNITGNFKGYNMGDALAGGVIGNTIGSNWNYFDSHNSGHFNYSFGKNATGIRALGGFAGTIFGYYERCYNSGNVINTDGLEAQFATRRIGGFGGAAWRSKGCVFHGKNCYNTGNVSDICHYIGGFVGILEDTNDTEYHLVENCYNTGTVTVVCQNAVSDAFGGFAGTLYNVVYLQNCRNEGKVVGVSRRSAGGLVGRAADYTSIHNCSNSGDVYVGAVDMDGALAKPVSPVVGGICGVVGSDSHVSIINSKNTGKVTAMAQYELAVQSAFASEMTVGLSLDPTIGIEDSGADAATISASAGATVVWIPKAQWSQSTIMSWIQ